MRALETAWAENPLGSCLSTWGHRLARRLDRAENPLGSCLSTCVDANTPREERAENPLRSCSQLGFARKPLNNRHSPKKTAWISLPRALNFLPQDFDFAS